MTSKAKQRQSPHRHSKTVHVSMQSWREGVVLQKGAHFGCSTFGLSLETAVLGAGTLTRLLCGAVERCCQWGQHHATVKRSSATGGSSSHRWSKRGRLFTPLLFITLHRPGRRVVLLGGRWFVGHRKCQGRLLLRGEGGYSSSSYTWLSRTRV